MTKLTESAVEQHAIELLEKLGYQYIYGPDIAPDRVEDSSSPLPLGEGMTNMTAPLPLGEAGVRASFEEVILKDRLKTAIARINATIPNEVIEDAIKQVLDTIAQNPS